MRLTLDTTVLAYAEGVNGLPAKNSALHIVEKLPPDSTFIPVQVLGELFVVLVRKAGRSPARAQTAVLGWHDLFPSIETSSTILLAAMELAAHHKLSICDAIVLSASAATGCRLLLSEDMQDGFTWNGVTIANPFAAKKNPLLTALLT